MKKNKAQAISAGDIFKSKSGAECKVVEFIRWDKIRVEFVDKYKHTMTVTSHALRSGSFKNPYHPTIYGIGFSGVGIYSATSGGKITPAYDIWNSMIQRCYSEKFQKKHPTYIGCTVSPDWHNFQNFAKWFYENRIEGFDLDKDLIKIGNKEYHPELCSFVPTEVNRVLGDCRRARGAYPQGVSRHGNGYRAHINLGRHRASLGTYKTPEEASRVYRREKELRIRRLAEEYKGSLDLRVYKNLMEYKVPLENITHDNPKD